MTGAQPLLPTVALVVGPEVALHAREQQQQAVRFLVRLVIAHRVGVVAGPTQLVSGITHARVVGAVVVRRINATVLPTVAQKRVGRLVQPIHLVVARNIPVLVART